MEPTRTINGLAVPAFLYGTAWKEAATAELTEMAIARGFRGIDTANQRKHYDEAAVGNAIGAAMASGSVTRDELFLQTKYTFQRGQDHRLPYNPTSSCSTCDWNQRKLNLWTALRVSLALETNCPATSLPQHRRALPAIGSPMHNDG